MINPLFLLRLGTLLTFATVNLVASDPRGFAGKLAERIRLAGGPVSRIPTAPLRALAAGQDTQVRSLIDAGHLTQGIHLTVEQGKRASASDRHLAQRTRERLEQLTSPVPSVTDPNRSGELRVLHVLTNSEPFTNSGYTVRSQHVLNCQQEQGITVRAVTRLGYPVLVGKLPTSPEQKVDGITYRRLLPWFYPAGLHERTEVTVNLLVQEARDFGATILHTTTDYTNAIVVAEAAKQLNIPWVYEVRGELESTWLSRKSAEKQAAAESSEFYQLARAKETACMKAANAVVALSEVSKQQLIERGVPEDKITVVPNAVDESEIGREFDRTEIRRELGLDETKKYVGSVTAVVDYEGLDTLIRSLEYLPEDYVVLIVGDGAARPELEALAKTLGLDERVIFAGRQPSAGIWRWYAALDVFALPRKDTRLTRTVTPIKPLIAMALEIPVIASDLPALREVTGSLAGYFPPSSSRYLAAAATRIIGSRQSGRQWASGRTWDKCGRSYRVLLEEMCRE